MVTWAEFFCWHCNCFRFQLYQWPGRFTEQLESQAGTRSHCQREELPQSPHVACKYLLKFVLRLSFFSLSSPLHLSLYLSLVFCLFCLCWQTFNGLCDASVWPAACLTGLPRCLSNPMPLPPAPPAALTSCVPCCIISLCMLAQLT